MRYKNLQFTCTDVRLAMLECTRGLNRVFTRLSKRPALARVF